MTARVIVASAGMSEGQRAPMHLARPELVGVSAAITRLRAEIHAIAASGFRTVLIQGESGVGKEVVAEAIRRASPRAAAAYEVFDCPAVPEDHLESELFGTMRGAFPGAVDKRGALERAHGGTIFFDEIAAMRRDHQAKILRVIEGKSFRRVGGSGPVGVDVAVVAAAHEDLAALAEDGAFRHDLYYRLVRDGVLMIPPLRERAEDVPGLVRHFVTGAGGSPVAIDPAALVRLAEYHWPGNVRQLQTVLRVALRLEAGQLTLDAVDAALARFTRPARGAAAGAGAAPAGLVAESPHAHPSQSPPASSSAAGALGGFHEITAHVQRRALLQAYHAASGNKTAAGVLLGFHLSPGEAIAIGTPISEARRNLALRKFRYWCGRLGIADALERRTPALHHAVYPAGEPPPQGG